MKGTVHCMVAELEDTLVTVTLAGCVGTWAAGVMSNNYVVITQLIFDLIALYCIFHAKCSQYIAVLQTDVVVIKPVTEKEVHAQPGAHNSGYGLLVQQVLKVKESKLP